MEHSAVSVAKNCIILGFIFFLDISNNPITFRIFFMDRIFFIRAFGVVVGFKENVLLVTSLSLGPKALLSIQRRNLEN